MDSRKLVLMQVKKEFFPKKQVANGYCLESPVKFKVEKLDCRIYHLEHQENFVLVAACLKVFVKELP